MAKQTSLPKRYGGINMKRKLLLVLVILAAVCCTAVASAGTDGYGVDLPDEVHIDFGENLIAYLRYPSGASPYDIDFTGPEGCQYGGVRFTGRGASIVIRFTAVGQYPLHFFTDSGFSKDVVVFVEDPPTPPTAIYLDQRSVFLAVGETKTIGYVLEGGSNRSPVRSYDDYSLSVDVSDDTISITGLKLGHLGITLKYDLGIIEVFVVDPCEGIRLTTPYDKGSVGYSLPLNTYNRDGERVYAYLELTEGSDCANIYSFTDGCSLEGIKPGWVTVKAYGTDGSTDEVRLKIYEPPTETRITLPSQTVRAGESITVGAEYLPEGTWKPLQLEMNPAFQVPAAEELEGPVAFAESNRIVGVVPGTCDLKIFANDQWNHYTITVIDSDQALVFDRPQPYFDWREPCRLFVHTREGKPVPAVYSAAGAYISVTPDGLLTCTNVNGNGHVTVQLENGLTYKYPVRAAVFPAWLAPEAEIISVPIDLQSVEMCGILSDVPISNPSLDLVLCSNDESIVKVDNFRLCPQAVGAATLTVWSRYNDVFCTVPLVVTEPCGRLFVDGTPDQTSLDIAYNTTVYLPAVTDYWGNPVDVTWQITYETSDPTGKHVVSLINNRQLKCTYFNGYAELYATAASGATYKLSVFAYQRDTTCSFRENEYTVTTGSFVQVDFQYGGYSNNSMTLEPQDVTFTLTGDTDCVLVDSHFSYHTFTGLREGTVTLTAKLYNGKTAKTVIHVVLPEGCKNGHDPEWFVQEEPTATLNGVRARRCSRCRVPLGQEEVIPCTGVLGFSLPDVYLPEDGTVRLTATLNGSPKQSFTYRSSNPNVVRVLGDVAVGVGLGTAEITVIKGDCVPAMCRVHVIVTTLTLPAGLVKIEDGAFQGVTVTCIVLPDQVISIGAYTFADCPRLMTLEIPASVTQIGENAFANDPSLTLTVTPGTYAEQYCIAHGLAYQYSGD